VQVGQLGVDLAHSLARPAADAPHERQPYPSLRGLVGRFSTIGQPDRGPEVVYRGVEIGEVHSRDPDGALGDGLGVVVPLGVRLLRHGGGKGDRSSRVSLGQPQKFGYLFPRVHLRSLARNLPIDIPQAG